MFKHKLELRVSNNELLSLLGYKRALDIFIDGKECDTVWTYKGLNGALGILARQQNIDILTEISPILAAERELNLLMADNTGLAGRIKAAQTQSQPISSDYEFRVCTKCGEPKPHGAYKGKFITTVSAGGNLFSLTECVMALLEGMREGGMRSNHALYLLKLALRANVLPEDFEHEPPPTMLVTETNYSVVGDSIIAAVKSLRGSKKPERSN